MILLRGEGKRKKKNVQPSGSSPLPPVLRQKRELCNRGNWKLSHEAVCTEKIEIPSYNLRLYLRFSTSLLLNIYFCVSYIYLLWFHRSSRASSLSLSFWIRKIRNSSTFFEYISFQEFPTPKFGGYKNKDGRMISSLTTRSQFSSPCKNDTWSIGNNYHERVLPLSISDRD